MNPVAEVAVTSDPRQWVLAVVINVLVLVELCVAMYLAASDPEDFTATFLKAFFGLLIPTLAAAILAKRRLRPAAAKA